MSFLSFITLTDLADAWNNLFFRNQSTLTICIFRILVGVALVTETRNWLRVYKQLLSPAGWFGYADYALHQKPLRFSLLNHLPATTRSVELLLGLQFIGGICLLLGVFAQVAAALCFLALVSIHNRNSYALSSGDTLYRFYCLFLIFAPSDSQLSITDTAHLLNSASNAWPWPLIMIRFFMANIYLKNVLFKLSGEWWRNGTATQHVFGGRIWNRRVLPVFLQHTWFYRSTTYGTLVIETALFSLIWIDEFRIPVVFAGILLHVGIWIFLRIGFFQFAMIVGLMAFIEPDEYQQLLRWLQSWQVH